MTTQKTEAPRGTAPPKASQKRDAKRSSAALRANLQRRKQAMRVAMADESRHEGEVAS